jgi:aminopeptidase N
MKKIILLILSFISLSLFCQTYTHADSLKGGSRPQRDVFDVHYYDLNLTLDINKQFITGYVDIYFSANLGGLIDKMQIDLYKNLKIISIKDSEGKDLSYKRDENAIFIDVTSDMLSVGKISVTYEGKPTIATEAPWEAGFVFKKDNKNRPWIGVACQGSGASIWWPCKDTQADEADSVRIAITTQSDLQVISNGNLRSTSPALSGVKTTVWFVSYPINNYDVSINIGNYVNFNEKYTGVEATYDLDYYVLDYNLEKAKKHFKQVVPMLNAFEKKLGPYPFPRDGFALIETPYLGMEHQSGIAYGNRYLKGYEGVERSGLPLGFDFIIVHETGHEYWGNSISTADVADMWVHEGFCTYSEALYVEEMYGADTALMYCNAWKLLVQNDVAIIGDYGVHKEGSVDMYNKGALMLHTLRWQVNNDKKWYPLIKNIVKDFRLKIITGNQLIDYINKQLGQDYSYIFEQYLKNSEAPHLHYDLTEKEKDLEVNIYFINVKDDFKLDLSLKTGLNKCKTYTITSKPKTILLKNMKKSDFKVDESHAYFLIK